jgi:DNA modification methylase
MKEFGLESLPEESRQKLLQTMTESLLKRLTLRILEELPEEARGEFEKVRDEEDPKKTEAFLRSNLEDYDGLAEKTVMEFKQEMKNEHPAPFPVALIERIIASTDAQLILDPFMGSGTTAVVAMGLKRNYIGIELSPDYCKMSEQRIEQNKKEPQYIEIINKRLNT